MKLKLQTDGEVLIDRLVDWEQSHRMNRLPVPDYPLDDRELTMAASYLYDAIRNGLVNMPEKDFRLLCYEPNNDAFLDRVAAKINGSVLAGVGLTAKRLPAHRRWYQRKRHFGATA